MWFVLAFAAALTQAGQFAMVKGPARGVPPVIMVLWTQALGVVVWAVYFLATGAAFALPRATWPWVAGAVVLAASMSYLLVRASAAGDISIVGPVLATSPVFAIIPDGVLTGTWPRGIGWVGIALSVFGTANLSRQPGRRFVAWRLLRRDDALSAFAAAIILGLLSGLDRRNALLIGVPSYLLSMHVVMTLGCAALIAAGWRRPFAAALAPRRLAAVLGHAALVTAGTILLMTAITLAPAAYVNSVRRTSAVFAVVLGWAVFREQDAARRLVGALIATLGVACLVLAR